MRGVMVMDWGTIISFIQGVGFPIACVLIMFQQMDKEREAHRAEVQQVTEALNNNTLILTELKAQLDILAGRTDGAA
jgi:large-conductance mechanosensitive channel